MYIKSLLLSFTYMIYFTIVIFVTYWMQWLTVLVVGSVRFTATDSYPGDVSNSFLIVESFFFSFAHFIVLTIFLLLYYVLLSFFKIKFHLKIPFIINSVIMLGLTIFFINKFLGGA
ncbi:hypothetical protein I6G82_08200 [Lysinibacillus macroides]|uniref:Uncharacterized protein n=1 Tax=Lysinibacillus macroides TaxID=33935 RepID=A0A0M9DII5_9BACI|nr:hypothetical protein [Lysinibacillus macroides]KOY81599.1 hypothetical protein ADM90_14490 [Lysinibacillus macroides]QPR69554.1 hypothetical protein I6G82_08200 [Lysinibacillus macroides]